MFLWFCRNGFRRPGGHFFVMNGFPYLFWKLFYVFVHLSADYNSWLRSIVLHGIHLIFKSIMIRVMRNFDFQYWAIFCIPSKTSFRRGSLVSKCRVFSAWTNTSTSYQLSVMGCYKILPTKNFLHKTSVFANFTYPSVFWKMFVSFAVLTNQISLDWTIDKNTLGATGLRLIIQCRNKFHLY